MGGAKVEAVKSNLLVWSSIAVFLKPFHARELNRCIVRPDSSMDIVLL